MLYLLCFLCPPLAVALTRRIGAAVLNFLLTLLVWIPGVIHALVVVSRHKAHERSKQKLHLIPILHQ